MSLFRKIFGKKETAVPLEVSPPEDQVQPEILPEFKDRIEMLQLEHPLDEPAESVIQRIINDVFEN